MKNTSETIECEMKIDNELEHSLLCSVLPLAILKRFLLGNHDDRHNYSFISSPMYKTFNTCKPERTEMIREQSHTVISIFK